MFRTSVNITYVHTRAHKKKEFAEVRLEFLDISVLRLKAGFDALFNTTFTFSYKP